MTKPALVLLVVVACSCKVREKDITGLYKLDHFPKTTLKINRDSTFEFSKNNRNPYLHPFDHTDEYYFDTKGVWKKTGKKTISLTSQADTLIYPLVSLKSTFAKDSSLSNFTFFDSYSDTVKILYVQFPTNIIMTLHSSMDDFDYDLTKHDTLEFHFYGYRPFTFISGLEKNMDYKVMLKPVFQPNIFRDVEFHVKRKKLIGLNKKAIFKLEKKSN